MTEPDEVGPRWQSIAPNTWTRLESDPTAEIIHTGPGIMLIATRRTPGVRTVPVTIQRSDGVGVDLAGAEHLELANGVAALLVWEPEP